MNLKFTKLVKAVYIFTISLSKLSQWASTFSIGTSSSFDLNLGPFIDDSRWYISSLRSSSSSSLISSFKAALNLSEDIYSSACQSRRFPTRMFFAGANYNVQKSGAKS